MAGSTPLRMPLPTAAGRPPVSRQVQSTTHVIGSSFKRLGSGLRQSLSNKGRVNSSQEDAAPLEEEQVCCDMGGAVQ